MSVNSDNVFADWFRRYAKFIETHPSFSPIINDFYVSAYAYRTGVAQTINVDRLWATFYPVRRRIRVDRIGVEVDTAGGAGAKMRLGIYKDDGNYYPGDLVVDAGEIDCTTTGSKTLTIDEILEPGIYWLVFNGNDATIKIYYMGGILGISVRPTYLDEVFCSYYLDQAYGPLPDPFPAGATKYFNAYMLSLRVSGVF